MMADRIIMRYLTQDCEYAEIYMKTPKALMHEEEFAVLDNHDKIAYSFMLDRAALSAKNGWVDSDGRVFIYFTVEEACNVLRLGRTKIAKIFKALVQVGLIERVPQGLGKPVIIYVKNIVVSGSDRSLSDCCTDESVQAVNSSEIHRRPHDGCPDDREMNSIKTDINDNECNYNISHINPIHQSGFEQKSKEVFGESGMAKKGDASGRITGDGFNGAGGLRQSINRLIHKHIGYTDFRVTRPDDLPMVDDIVELMTDVIMTEDREIMISRIPRNGDMVRQRFMLMKSDVVGYVIDSVKRVTSRIRNMRQYLLTSLFNATDTIGYYYGGVFMNRMRGRYGYPEAVYGG